jgi:hypothetical protein
VQKQQLKMEQMLLLKQQLKNKTFLTKYTEASCIIQDAFLFLPKG